MKFSDELHTMREEERNRIAAEQSCFDKQKWLNGQVSAILDVVRKESQFIAKQTWKPTRLDGYIFRTDDGIKSWLRFTEKLPTIRKSQYFVSDDNPDDNGETPIWGTAIKKQACIEVTDELYRCLQNDGFSSIQLEVTPCYSKRRVHVKKGLLFPNYSWEEVDTDTLLGYILRISIKW